jgi:peptidoglycan/LPS O-acetylase OafA/YrhL
VPGLAYSEAAGMLDTFGSSVNQGSLCGKNPPNGQEDASFGQRTPYKFFGTFRLLLALTVVFSHSNWLLVSKDASLQINKLGLGGVAVMVFFVLSGYIISEAADTFYRGRPVFFLMNRFLRLVPPYLGALALSLMIHAYMARSGWLQKGLSFEGYDEVPSGIFSAGTLVYNATAIFPILVSSVNRVFEYSGIPFTKFTFVRYAWALNVEFVFYLIMFGVLWLTCTVKRYQRETLMFVVAAILGEYVLSEYILEVHTARQFVPYFLAGVMLYHWEKFDSRSRVFVAGALLCLIFLQYSRHRQALSPLGVQWFRHLGDWEVIVPTLLVIGLVLVIGPLSRIRVREDLKRADKWFGDLSYSVYLNHYPVLILTSAFFGASQNRGIARWLAVLVVVCAVSWMMKVVIETPMQGLRDHIRGGRV